MERNLAKAKHAAWPSFAWVQLSFSPFPVGHPISADCIRQRRRKKSNLLQASLMLSTLSSQAVGYQ